MLPPLGRVIFSRACRSVSLKTQYSNPVRFISCRNQTTSTRLTLQDHALHDEQDKPTTHFGFQEVHEEEKFEKVYEVFRNVATKYDVMNDAMSAGIHRLWKDEFIRIMRPGPHTRLLDVAGGTGDIAFRFLEYVHAHWASPSSPISSCVTVSDVNQEMLDVGQQKAKAMRISEGMSWIQADAESLPFESSSFDAYTIAFGIRNCTHIDRVLSDAFRVLRKGGCFMCLEFSHVQNPLLESVYDWYSFNIIPVLGHVIAGDWHSYQYLVESIRQFPPQEEFADMIRLAGFSDVSYRNWTFGTVAVHSGFKA